MINKIKLNKTDLMFAAFVWNTSTNLQIVKIKCTNAKKQSVTYVTYVVAALTKKINQPTIRAQTKIKIKS